MKWLRTLLALGFLLAALPAATLPAATLAAEEPSPCPQGSTWVDMDDPDRHPAALDRAALGIYDEDGDAQTCVRPVADPRDGNLRLGYKVADLDIAGNCPDDSGAVDTTKPGAMPFPLTPERIAPYDLNGDGRVCVTRSQLGEGDFMIDVQVADNPFSDLWCGGRLATIVGTPQDDWIDGTSGDDVIVGLAGDDYINGMAGNDIVCGGEDGDDLDDEDEGNDYLYGGTGDDSLDGAEGHDYLYAGPDDDFVEGGGGNDTVNGGPNDDELYGDEDDGPDLDDDGDDTLNGGTGKDDLDGGMGDDTLLDTGEYDRLDGGPDRDLCISGGNVIFLNCEPEPNY
jgi:Ca2+-binding RTX toxin-like protein